MGRGKKNSMLKVCNRLTSPGMWRGAGAVFIQLQENVIKGLLSATCCRTSAERCNFYSLRFEKLRMNTSPAGMHQTDLIQSVPFDDKAVWMPSASRFNMHLQLIRIFILRCQNLYARLWRWCNWWLREHLSRCKYWIVCWWSIRPPLCCAYVLSGLTFQHVKIAICSANWCS